MNKMIESELSFAQLAVGDHVIVISGGKNDQTVGSGIIQSWEALGESVSNLFPVVKWDISGQDQICMGIIFPYSTSLFEYFKSIPSTLANSVASSISIAIQARHNIPRLLNRVDNLAE